jgi:hypothetical protein
MENCSSATIPEVVCNHGMFSALAKTHYKKKNKEEKMSKVQLCQVCTYLYAVSQASILSPAKQSSPVSHLNNCKY